MKKKVLISFLSIFFIIGFIISGIYFSTRNKNEDKTEIVLEDKKNESVVNNVNLIDIPEYFEVDEAISQGCFVITEDKIYNKRRLDEFIKNTSINAKNRIQDKIRIVVYGGPENCDQPCIYDLEYRIYDEKEINGVNKSGYILITDPSRVQYLNMMTLEEVKESRKIRINENLPGEIYGISIVKDKNFDMNIISLSLYDNVDENTEEYEEIEISRYDIKSEIVD